MSTISSDQIISILKEEIKNYDLLTGEQETGTVISVGDGVVHAVDGGHAVSHRDDGTGFLFAGEQIVILDLFF